MGSADPILGLWVRTKKGASIKLLVIICTDSGLQVWISLESSQKGLYLGSL